MKIKSQSHVTNRGFLSGTMSKWLCALVAITSFTAALNVQAASQTWSNAPVDVTWTNVNNWNGHAVPGALNSSGNTVNADVAFFTNALSGGIGGIGNPILVDDATIAGDRSRSISGITFDGVTCGSYAISSLSPPVLAAAGVPQTGYLVVSHLGGITNSAAVTSSQTILVPLEVLLPSSTAGLFSIVNNSPNPSATLTINTVVHGGATTRATTYTLDGVNTGNNIITNLSEGPGNGTGGFTKTGTGTWILAGPSIFPAGSPINIIAGTLIVRDPGAFGSVASATIGASGTVQIDGVAITTATLTLTNGGTLRLNGTATIPGVTVANVVNTSVTVATTSASDVMTLGNAANKVTGGAVSTTLHFAGPGTVLLDVGNNYLGKFSVDAGTNQLTDPGALGAGANYNIGAGGVFDVSPLGAITYAVTTKTFGAGGTGTAIGSTAAAINADPAATVDFGSKSVTLTFTPALFTGDTTHPSLLCARGTLSFSGNAITVNNVSGTPLGAGTYKLIHQNTGSIVSSGGFVTLISGSGLGAGLVGEIVASGGDLNLIVTAYIPKNLVWTGGDVSNPNFWDRLTSINWLAGATPSAFNLYDSATFNSVGSSNPAVNLVQVVSPSSVTVDTSANDYTFSTTGSGQIAGGTGLVKIGTGNLFLNTANTYSGGTLITNGTIKIGIQDAIPSTGLGDVTNNSPGTIDLNGFNNTIGALNGNGTVNVTGGGTSILTVGDNDNSGTFAGILQNTAGTLGLTKTGLGSETLTKSNSYTGATDIEQGTLKVLDPNGLGAGATALTINGGSLDIATNVAIASLAGAGGTIVNASTSTTNTLIVQGTATTTFSGTILNGTTGKIALKVLGGSLRMQAANTYTNGTIVGSGATFLIHNSPANVPGPLIASNTATLGLTGGSASPGTPATITTVDGATVTFTSAAEGDIWTGQFLGSATTTNRFTGPVSAGGVASFSNFFGVVQIALTSGNFRFFNGAGVSGGDNTMFEFDAGNVHTRDAQTVSLGAVSGGTSLAGIGGNGTAGTVTTYVIGAKNIDSSFEGYISGSNNLVKAGSGRLTLDGATNIATTLNGDGSTTTNLVLAPLISYLGTTVISNGVLALVVPNTLTNSTSITLASPTAVLDVSQMGYIDTDNTTFTNLVTNGVFQVMATTPAGIPQLLAGFGTIKGNGVTNSGTINPGSSVAGGTLSISNGLTILAGATNYFDLSDDLTGLIKPSDQIKVQGNVTLSGNSIIGIGALNGTLKVGVYPLIRYSGNLVNEGGIVPSGPISNFALGGVFPATSRATLVLSNAPGEVDLVVVSLNNLNLTWTGDAVSNIWDVVNSFTFTNVPNGTVQFFQLDNVTFDDTANPTNDSVFLAGTLAPATITVNSATNIIFGGNGTIEGPVTLVKKNTGTLILTNGANSYTGGTVLSNGVVNVGSDSGGNQNDLALGTGPATVNTSGELRFGGNTGAVVNHFITNAIVINGGVVKAQDGVQHLTNSTVTVTSVGGTLTTVFATKNLVLDSPLLGTGNVNVSAVPAGTNAPGGQVILNNGTNTFSGTVTVITNGNLGLSGLAGISNSTAVDVQLGGILDISTRSNSSWSVLLGQTLKGNGTVRGKFITVAAGSTLAPGVAGALGTLTVTNLNTTNFTVVTLAGTTAMDINRGLTPNSDRLVTGGGTNVFGGTLTVNNLGLAPQAGDFFTLFTSLTNTGTFATLNLPVLSSGLAWSNSLAVNGRLTVVASVNTSPTNITATVSGNVLTLAWPADHTGWHLQLQTNSLATGLYTNWVTLLGTELVHSTNITVNPANGAVFYRMVYP